MPFHLIGGQRSTGTPLLKRTGGAPDKSFELLPKERKVTNQSVMPVWKRVRSCLGNCYRDRIRRDVPILACHRIGSVDGTSLETLTKILDYVASEHRVLTLGELAGMLRRKMRIPKDGIVLTFDDATLDQYALAGPELNERGLRATFAVIGCTLLARSVPPLHWYLYVLEETTKSSVRFGFPPHVPEQTLQLGAAGTAALKNCGSPLRRSIQASEHTLGTEIVTALGEALDVAPPTVDELFMSCAQMRELQDLGHEAAAHSMRHQDVNEPDEESWTRDLQECFSLMNEAFGRREHPYIYPFGKERRPTIHEKIKQAGFCCAATTEPGTNRQGADRFSLRRIGIDSHTSVPFATIY